MRNERPQTRDAAGPWFIAAALVALLALGVMVWLHTAADDAGHFGFTPIVPTARAWHPDSGYFCSGLEVMSAQLPGSQIVATVVNAAPTAAAHNAALALYHDVVLGRSTADDLMVITASYDCPST